MIPLAEANALTHGEFVERFGDIAEHSPWVADRAARARPFADHAAMIAAFQAAIRDASGAEQIALLRAHPELAGRAAIAGDLAEESRKEQKGAGLDRMTPEEYARFMDLNDRYRERFGFPFIFAVRGADKHRILEAFALRVDGGEVEEFLTALGQVCRIVRFRLEDRVSP